MKTSLHRLFLVCMFAFAPLLTADLGAESPALQALDGNPFLVPAKAGMHPYPNENYKRTPLDADKFRAMTQAEQIAESISRTWQIPLSAKKRQMWVEMIQKNLDENAAKPPVTQKSLGGGSSARSSGQLLAGAAWRSITPPIGSPSAGYGGRLLPTEETTDDPYDYAKLYQPMQGMHDVIRAKALIFDNGQQLLCFIALEVIGTSGVNDWLVAECQRRGIPLQADGLFVFSTHTHSGPGAVSESLFWQLATVDLYDQRLFDMISTRVADAVQEAYNNRVPAKFGTMVQERDGASRNRRGDQGKYDREMFVMRVDRKDNGKPIACLFTYALHGTSLDDDNWYFGGDCIGYGERAAERLIGDGVVAMFANGSEGDVSPNGGGFDGAKRVGDLLGTWAHEIWTEIGATVTMEDFGNFKTSSQIYILPPPYMRIGLIEPSIPLNLTVDISGILEAKARFSALNINGHTAFSTLPGEAITDVGQIVKNFGRSHFAKFCLLGLSQDQVGYFTTETEYWQGGYEAGVSLFGPTTGLIMSGHSIDQLDNVL